MQIHAFLMISKGGPAYVPVCSLPNRPTLRPKYSPWPSFLEKLNVRVLI